MKREWPAADRPTLADMVLSSYIARAPEGNVSLAHYPNIGSQLRRIISADPKCDDNRATARLTHLPPNLRSST